MLDRDFQSLSGMAAVESNDPLASSTRREAAAAWAEGWIGRRCVTARGGAAVDLAVALFAVFVLRGIFVGLCAFVLQAPSSSNNDTYLTPQNDLTDCAASGILISACASFARRAG